MSDTQQATSGPVAAPYDAPRKVDLQAGQVRSEVSSQWFSRPDDQKFLSLDDLVAHTRRRYEGSETLILNNRDIEFVAPEVETIADTHKLAFGLPNGEITVPTNWSFGQTASLAKAPAGYLKTLPSQIVADNLTWGMRKNREIEQVKAYYTPGGEAELMAITGPQYGRIPDYEVVEAIQQIAGKGLGDMDWKVPGKMEIGSGIYDPLHPVSLETTTLYASDRDLFIFLVDDRNPVEIGKLPDGSPDLLFRGFYVWNSEVGSKSMGIATMYLRAVCCNRLLWGVEEFSELTIRHSKHAPARFVQEAAPALTAFAHGDTKKIVEGVEAAKAAIVAADDDEALTWLRKTLDVSKTKATSILETIERQEQHPARSIWDMAQGITAVAQEIKHQDDRVTFERTAKAILDRVAA